MRSKIKNFLLTLLGSVFVVLGFVGALLPVLPTTPFLLLALACFARSSPRFHRLLLSNRWFGHSLRQWEDSRTITRSSKLKAILLIVLTFTVSIVILSGKTQLQIGLVGLGSVLIVFLWRLKEAERVVENVTE